MTKSAEYDVAVVGDWHLAFVTAACLADAGHRTALVNPLGVAWTEFPACPVHEPGLTEMITNAQKKGLLCFENGIKGQWSAKVVWMAVDTPITEKDEPQVEPLIEIAEALKAHNSNLDVFATSSQVPIGFCRRLEAVFGKKVAYIPENLRLGQGIATFANADRTVIGASTREVAEKIKRLMVNFKTQFLLCDLVTSEMVKHANNAFLATSISFANEMARIGSHFGVDSYLVAQALKLDTRIGTKAYVAPGLGFAGGTLPRDLRVLEKISKENSIPAPLVSAVLEINRSTSELVAEVVAQNLPLGADRRTLILGYTYKADTDTLRRSLSIEIAQSLIKKGIECHGIDPFMNGKNLTELDGVIQHHDSLESVPPCSVAILMTSRPIFLTTDWSRLQKPQGKSTLLVDTQKFLDPNEILRAGLRYRLLWSPEIKNDRD
jgi:UDPglucose 6-dehydrogenase